MAAGSFFYGGGSGGDGVGGGGGGGGGSILVTNKRVHCSSSSFDHADSFVPRSSPFQSSRSMVSFEDIGNGSGGHFFQSFDNEDNGDDEYDEYFNQPEKKRRLTRDQVRFLEKSFDSDNKLEPDRKIQLAKELGLQPRQVAIWFQNRRARLKNKQLEKDYDDLQENYNKLKADFENLVKEKEKLKFEAHELSDKLLLQEKGTSDSSSTKSPCEPQQILHHECNEDVSKKMNTGYGQDGNFTTENLEFDDRVQTSLLEHGNSSYIFEQVQREEGSLDEKKSFGKMFQLSVDGYTSAKIERAEHRDPHSVNAYYLGLPGDDQAFGLWSY